MVCWWVLVHCDFIGALFLWFVKNRVVLFCGEFSLPGDQKKKKAGVSNKGIFEIKKKESPYLEKKKVRSRQI